MSMARGGAKSQHNVHPLGRSWLAHCRAHLRWFCGFSRALGGAPIAAIVFLLTGASYRFCPLRAQDAHEAEGRATGILKGLGFSDSRMSRPTSELSGGWMTRVSLACALFCRPGLCTAQAVFLVKRRG